MSAPSGEKQTKAKSKKSSINKGTKQAKGKEAAISDEKFRGDGVSFKCKLLGVSEVAEARGDNMCIEAIKKLKQHIKQTGEHKQKIILNITLKGIRIFDEKTKTLLFEHPVNKVSFITHDPEDKKIFGYICSTRCKTGHTMYAVKYDKVAGVITATLFELFQAVFKLRQEAANQKRAQANGKPNPKASNIAVSNGPSTASPADENNIYEEPKTTSTPVTTQADNNSDGHYKVSSSRPLPPAPYASSVPQDSPKTSRQDMKLNQSQSMDSPATSFASESFFSASVFAQVDTASDSVSLSSIDMIRKESISSSSSETASFDARGLELKTGHSISTPATACQKLDGLTSPAVAPPKTGVAPNEDHDYETIPSASNYETIPSVSRTEKKDVKAEFKGFNFKETFTSLEPFPRSDSLNDPSVSKNSSAQESSPSGAFGDDDLFKSFGDSNFENIAVATSSSAFPTDDPFAPTTATSAARESQLQGTDAFTSSDLFETAFATGEVSLPFAPSKGSDDVDTKVEGSSEEAPEETASQKLQTESMGSGDRFEAVFGTAEMSPPPFKPTETIQTNNKNDPSDTTWASAAVQENENKTVDAEDEKSEKSEESKMEFKCDDSFGMDFNSENKNQAQLNSSDAVKNEISWSTAFDTKPQGEASFSWDDSFGASADSKDGEIKTDFGRVAFEDAFASTPFKDTAPKPETQDSFGDFGAVAWTPAASNSEVSDKDSKDDVPEEATAEEKEQGDSEEELQAKEANKTENERKPKLAEDEDLFSSFDKENDSEKDKKTIPKVKELINDDLGNDVTSEDSSRPMSVPIEPMKPKREEVVSDVPPPLPPRVKATLPVLPPRPRAVSSPMPTELPPTPPRPPVISSGRDSPATKDIPKRAPPALPPRIDLEMEKAQVNSNPAVPISITGFHPDAFSSPKNEESSTSWPTDFKNDASTEEKNKENLTSNSKTSPDPFGDDFFTDFSAIKDSAPNEASQGNQNFFDDPFLAKEGADDLFKVDFGGQDLFADFSSNNKGKKKDPFTSDGEAAFPGFSTSNDPFSDVNDPFADKIALSGDPFGTNPKKEESDNLSFQLSKDSLEGDFADSFA